jgi:hypothetical protein
MKKASLLLLFAVLALLLSLWWWQRGDELTPVPAEQESAPPAVANGPATPSVAPASDAANLAERTAAADASAASSELAADEGRFYDVLVVDEVSQQPIAGADVWGVDDAVRNRYGTLPLQEYRALQREPDVLAERFGRTARSDANGRLRMFASRKGVSLHGRHGGRYGRLRILGAAEPPADGHRLVLVADETLRVIVRDAAGQPAVDVPVDLRRRLADGSEQDEVVGNNRDTDRNGLVAFSHVQLVRRGEDGWHGKEAVAAFVVMVSIHGLPPVRAVLEAGAPLPSEPVELQLPPCGALSVRLVLAGKPLPGVDRMALHAGPDEDSDASNQSWEQPVDAEGWAHFPFVPVQPTLFVRGRGDVMHLLPDLSVPGPGAPGVAVRHEVELGQQAIVLRGRVLDPEGRPFDVRNHGLSLSFDIGVRSGMGSFPLDAEGRFLHVLRPHPRGSAGAPEDVQLEKFELKGEVDGQPLQGKVEPRKLQLGVNDLGDIRLHGDPIVCAGRLVGYAPPPQGRVGLVVEFARATADGVRWQPEHSCRGRVADDGTFVVNGKPKRDRLRLLVVSAHLQPVVPVEFQPGQRGIAIPVAVGATWALEGSLPKGGDLDDLALMLRNGPADATVHAPPDDGMPFASIPDPRRARLERRNDETVRATWAGLPPGTYTLSVELPGHGAPLHQRPGIVLPMPADAQQPALDLREWMRWVQVELRHADGAPLPRQQWGIFPQPQAMTGDAIWGGTGQFTARGQQLVGRSVRELLVTGQGFVPQRVAVEGDAVVALMRPWPKLELALAPGTEVPEGMQLAASLAPATAVPPEARCRYGGSSGRLERRLLPEVRDDRFVDGRTALPIGDGMHRLTLFLRLGNVGFPLARATPGEVVAGGLVVVTLDADDVRTAAERLRTMVGGEAPAGQPK